MNIPPDKFIYGPRKGIKNSKKTIEDIKAFERSKGLNNIDDFDEYYETLDFEWFKQSLNTKV